MGIYISYDLGTSAGVTDFNVPLEPQVENHCPSKSLSSTGTHFILHIWGVEKEVGNFLLTNLNDLYFFQRNIHFFSHARAYSISKK